MRNKRVPGNKKPSQKQRQVRDKSEIKGSKQDKKERESKKRPGFIVSTTFK